MVGAEISVWTPEREAMIERLWPRYGAGMTDELNRRFPDLAPVTPEMVRHKASRLGLKAGPGSDNNDADIRRRSMRFAIAGRKYLEARA